MTDLTTITCGGCTAQYSSNSKRCPLCSTPWKLEEQVLNDCIECGTKFAASLASCPHCGSDQSGESQERVEEPALFDPSEHSVVEVNQYLVLADDEERQRVLDSERAGKARISILG